MSLHITRKASDSLVIEDLDKASVSIHTSDGLITVTLESILNNSAVLSVDAPRKCSIIRTELCAHDLEVA